MNNYLDLDSFIQSRSLGYMSLDEFVATRSPFLSLDDYAIQKWGIQKKKNYDAAKRERRERSGILDMLEQFGRGVTEEATLGASKHVIPENDPQTIKESISRGVGQLVGFLSPLGLISKAKGIIKGTAMATKAAQAASGISLFKKTPKIAKLVNRMIDTSTTLAGAEALSDILYSPQDTARRAMHGAKIGAIFGAAGIIHIPQHPFLGGVLRQFGGRALMHLGGEYQIKDRFKAQNIAQTVFDEALMSFFLFHGISEKELLHGTQDKTKKQIIDSVYASVDEVNAMTDAGAKLDIPKKMLQARMLQKMSADDIGIQSVPSQDQITRFTDKFKQGVDISKDYRVPVSWDGTLKKYVTQSGSSLVEARKRATIELLASGQDANNIINVEIVKPKPGESLKMRKPWELAMLYGTKKFTKELPGLLERTRHWAYNIKTGTIRPVLTKWEYDITEGSQWTKRHPIIKLSKNEIAFSTTQFDPLKRRWSFEPISKGVDVPTFQWKGKKIFYRGKLDRRLEDIAIEKKELERQYEITKDQAIGDRIVALDQEATDIYNARVQRYNKLDTALLKRGAKPTDINKIINIAENKVNALQKIPEQILPATYQLMLNKRLDNLKIGLDLDTFLVSVGINDRVPRFKHLELFERKFFDMEKVPVGDRLGVLFSDYARENNLLQPQLTGEFAQQAEPLRKLWQNRRNELFKAYYWKSKNLTGSGSVLRQIFTMKRWWQLADVRKTMAHLENLTGIPFARLDQKISNASILRERLVEEHTKSLNKFYTMPAEEQSGVAQWFSMSYRGENTRMLEMSFTPEQVALKTEIQNIMAKIQPLVTKYRVMQWIEQVYNFRMAASRDTSLKSKFKEPIIFRHQKEMEPLLKEAADIYFQSLYPGNEGIFDTWLQTKGQNLGTIGEGVYLLDNILSPKREYHLTYEQEASFIDVFGRGHLQSREPLLDKALTVDLDKARIDAFRDRHLTVRIHAYINQIMNVLHVEPEIQKLDKLVFSLGKELSQAKPPGIGKVGPEAKGYSLLDLFTIYAHRMKGYPVKRGLFGEALTFTQSTFFRSLVVRPWLWFRNILQSVVTVPHKEMVIDPRYRMTKFKNLPSEVQDKFLSRGVDQLQAIHKDFLELQASEKIKNIPVLKTFFKIAESVGQVYSLSDRYNRRSVFTKTFFRSFDYINKFNNRQVDIKTLEKRLGLSKMELPNQNYIRGLIQDGEFQEAAFEIANWMTVNSQWAYRRTQKSLFEMTGEGESWTNLLTWSKGISQQCIESASKIKDGLDLIKQGDKARGFSLMRDGAGVFVGLGIAGSLANALLESLSFSYKSKFQSYGVDMFMWEFGGVSVEIVKNISDVLSSMVTSFDGTPEERQRAVTNAVKLVDNVLIRQLLPFSKNALSVVEACTNRAYISPVYDAWSKATSGFVKDKKYVQRTMLEGIAHGIMSTDPNKSEDVRKWVFKKLYEYNSLAARPSQFQWFYRLMADRYKYLNDLFQRYTPYETYRDKAKKARIKLYQEIQSKETLQDYLYKSQKQIYETRKQYGY